ncbi:hypothetical protein AAG906_035301 [Vitis piasezkii]
MPPSAPSVKGSGFAKLPMLLQIQLVSIISNANGTLEKIEPVNLPNGPGGENFRLVVYPKADDGGQKLSTKSVELSSPPSMMKGSIHIKFARWDEKEWPSNQVMESRSVEGVTIGYVPDEW